MDRTKAAARTAAALGEKVTADDVEHVLEDMILLTDGRVVSLCGGNAALVKDGAGEGRWMRNGRPWDDPDPRPL
jgi:hypothetical protein